ncbi:hypothetical protein PJP12_29845, partial [Mycobacterium kansasii]
MMLFSGSHQLVMVLGEKSKEKRKKRRRRKKREERKKENERERERETENKAIESGEKREWLQSALLLPLLV